MNSEPRGEKISLGTFVEKFEYLKSGTQDPNKHHALEGFLRRKW